MGSGAAALVMFLFPGQGSQRIGMMRPYAELDLVRRTFDEASDALGEDLYKLVEEGSEAELALTRNTQPVMLAAGVAVWRAFCALSDKRPAYLAGHSLGEFTALVAAEAISFADAVRLVRLRAEAMQEAVPAGEGAMAAVLGLGALVIEAVCREVPGFVAPANYNAPDQTVIAGERSAVEQAAERLRAAGAKRVVMLPVSAPFHTPLMKPAAERLAEALTQVAIAPPSIPVIHNVDLSMRREPEAIREALIAQAWQPVRWSETIERAAKQLGVGVFIECGPGKVLWGLGRRIAPRARHLALADAASIRQLAWELKEDGGEGSILS